MMRGSNASVLMFSRVFHRSSFFEGSRSMEM
jgi:hypothetical protein